VGAGSEPEDIQTPFRQGKEDYPESVWPTGAGGIRQTHQRILTMKRRKSPKRRLISQLHVLKQLIEEENSLPMANISREVWKRDFETKSAELVSMEIAAYRKKYKLEDKYISFLRSVPTRIPSKTIEI